MAPLGGLPPPASGGRWVGGGTAVVGVVVRDRAVGGALPDAVGADVGLGAVRADHVVGVAWAGGVVGAVGAGGRDVGDRPVRVEARHRAVGPVEVGRAVGVACDDRGVGVVAVEGLAGATGEGPIGAALGLGGAAIDRVPARGGRAGQARRAGDHRSGAVGGGAGPGRRVGGGGDRQGHGGPALPLRRRGVDGAEALGDGVGGLGLFAPGGVRLRGGRAGAGVLRPVAAARREQGDEGEDDGDHAGGGRCTNETTDHGVGELQAGDRPAPADGGRNLHRPGGRIRAWEPAVRAHD